MKKANYKLLGFFAAVFAIVSVNVISPMQVKAADGTTFTVNITDSSSESGNSVVITGDGAHDEDHEYIFSGTESHTISGAAFQIHFNLATNSVAYYGGKYYKDVTETPISSTTADVSFVNRYRPVTISGGVKQADGTLLVNNVKVWLSDAGNTPLTTSTNGGYTQVDRKTKIMLHMSVPVGGGTASYSLNGATPITYTVPIELEAEINTINITTTGGSYPFYIYGLSTETQTGSTLKLLGGQIVLYQNGSAVACSSCTGGTATYYLPSYNNLSIYMVPTVVGTTTPSSIVGQISTDGGINYVNIATNQFYQLPNSTTRLAVRFGTGTVTPGSTGADTKVHINFKGLVGAGISTDLKTITVPGGKVTMKASSIDQQFGHVDLNGDTRVTVSSGSKVDITLTPNSGYTAQYKIGNGSFVTGNTISITPTSDQTITIQFVSSAPAKTPANKDKVPKTGIFHNYVMIFGILALVVAICVAGVVIYFKKNDKEKEKTR